MSATRQGLDTAEPEHEFAGVQLLLGELEGSEVPVYELGHLGDDRVQETAPVATVGDAFHRKS